jgi:hypothetical protein
LSPREDDEFECHSRKRHGTALATGVVLASLFFGARWGLVEEEKISRKAGKASSCDISAKGRERGVEESEG